MNKIINIFLILFLLSISNIFSQTTGTINLKGYVPEILDISIDVNSNASNLDLSQDVNNLHIADVKERSNKVNGYTVSLESVNQGNFESISSDNTDSLNYTLNYDGTDIDISNGSAILTDSNTKSNDNRIATKKELLISYSGSDLLLYEGDYEDTLTLTITAK